MVFYCKILSTETEIGLNTQFGLRFTQMLLIKVYTFCHAIQTSVLQIRRANRDNLEIISHISP